MRESTVGFIGLGLIGGSLARALRKADPGLTVMAYAPSGEQLSQAREDGVVDVILDDVDERMSACDMIFLCAPVEFNREYLRRIRPFLKEGALVTDVGSTKSSIHRTAKELSMEHCFVGGHPMAGSEKTGYENSSDHLLENAYYMITPPEGAPEENVERVQEIARAVNAIPMVLSCREHDLAVAAISHLPHIVASSLVNLVRDTDDPRETMKQIAAGGFKDITRIASASPKMWEQICMTNTENIARVLEMYIGELTAVLGSLKQRDADAIRLLFSSSREYRNSISDRSRGAMEPEYSFSVDIVDEVGSISTLSVILAAKGISIKNIGINHSREHGEGALRISFYDEESRNAAWKRLEDYKYTLIP